MNSLPGSFFFYGNKSYEDIVLKQELEDLQKQNVGRFQVYYFLSQELVKDKLFQGRLDERKISLIINQILHLDEEDEESTIWDSTDKVLICGPGAMIKSVANACYNHGIPKRIFISNYSKLSTKTSIQRKKSFL
jgi:ring-1,2-phenylacetyl-CoA epoxidase subunit PaaE